MDVSTGYAQQLTPVTIGDTQLPTTRLLLSSKSVESPWSRYLWAGLKALMMRPGGGHSIRCTRDRAVATVVKTYGLDRSLSVASTLAANRDGKVQRDIYDAIKEGWKQVKGAQLYEIPVATVASWNENHTISIVIDQQQKSIYVIDTKGYDPTKLHLAYQMPGNVIYSTPQTVGGLIKELVRELSLPEGYQVEATSFFQKPRDCVFAVEAVVRELAGQKAGERSLYMAQQKIHDQYSKVDALREKFFQK